MTGQADFENGDISGAEEAAMQPKFRSIISAADADRRESVATAERG